MSELRKQAAIFIKECLAPDAKVVVGVSGGPDSLALLHVLCAVLDKQHLVVAHLNHGMRPGARQEAAFVQETAVSRQLPYYTETVDVTAWAAAQRLSLEEAGRLLRYRFLAQVAHATGATAVAVGHHADDQAETVLMHLLRGAGLSGLRGMQKMRPLPEADDILLIRPFLSISRAQIESYCTTHELHPVFDESNDDTQFFRNRIRHQLLPLLKVYNPRIKSRLQNLAEIAAADYALLDQTLADSWGDVLRNQGAEWLQLDKEKWLGLPLSLKRSMLRLAVGVLRPFQQDIRFQTIEQARTLIERGQVGGQATLPGNLHLLNGYETVTIAADLSQVPIDLPLLPDDDQQILSVPGKIKLSSGWVLQAERIESFDLSGIENNQDEWQAYLSVDADRLIVRSRYPGERFQPLGMNGHSAKIKNVMINRKVPAMLRDKWPLVAYGDQLLWFVGYQIDERVRITTDSQSVVHLTCFKSGNRQSNDEILLT